MTRDCMYYPKAGVVIKTTDTFLPLKERPIHVLDCGDRLYVELRYRVKSRDPDDCRIIAVAVFYDVFKDVDRKELDDMIRSAIRSGGYRPDDFDPMPVAVSMPTDMYDAFLKRVNARKGVRNG